MARSWLRAYLALVGFGRNLARRCSIMPDIDPQKLLMGIVALMRKLGAAPTRTRLMKFLYLADLHCARYSDGVTLTSWSWRVDSFGPMAVDALRLMDRGVNEGWLLQWDAGSDDEDTGRRAVGYSPVGNIDDLVALVPAKVIGKLSAWIKTYGDSTPRLLRFVYGETEPMDGAVEGQLLDFSLARPIVSSVSVDHAKIDPNTRRKMDALMRKVRAQYEAAISASATLKDGPYDDEYLRGVPTEEPIPKTGRVLIHFSGPGDSRGRN